MKTWTPYLAAVTTILLLPACNPLDSTPPNGELGNGSFFYLCDSDSDPVCDGQPVGSSSTRMSLPAAVAVGARFSIEYEASLSGEDPGGSTTIESASSEILTQTESFGSSFKGIKPGLAAILARRGDTITDFVHVRVLAPDELRVDVDGGSEAISSVTLEQGTSARLRAFAVDEADTQLAGALDAQWSTSDDGVASFDGLTTDNEVSVVGANAGQATVTISLGEKSLDLTVEVGGTTGAGGGGTGGAGGGGEGGGS